MRSGSPITVDVVIDVTEDVTAAMTHLLPQMSASAAIPSREQLREIVSANGTSLLFARLDGQVVGMLTLALFRIPSGVRAWIEDVVVDTAARGRGVGELLTRAAIEIAVSKGARTVELTSRPAREAANRLYSRLGFQPRDTNVYRYTVSS
jgi:ribosomal protein S18 acetylase RimI-like enzyme